jgi:RNA polymerase sigma-70 factor (ECF subfamily)
VELATKREVLAASTKPAPIASLTAAMRRSDEEAYREFFRLYFHRLLGYLLVVTRGDEELSRDLLQQVMIKVAKHVRVFEEEQALWRWLTLLARTAAIDHARKRNRYFGFLQRLWETQAEASEPAADESAVEKALVRELEALPNEDRQLLSMKYLEGSPVKVIAAALQLSEKAVESRLTRARAKLKEEILRQLRHE